MEGLVSLLDKSYSARVDEICAALHRRFSLPRLFNPHVSFHVARDYNGDRLRQRLEQLAAATPPFTIQTGGLGIFTLPEPIVYITVTRTPALTRLHQSIFTSIGGTARDVVPYYKPVHWIPHITLGHLDEGQPLGPVVDFLATESFQWNIPIDNLAYLQTATSDAPPALRLPLGGG